MGCWRSLGCYRSGGASGFVFGEAGLYLCDRIVSWQSVAVLRIYELISVLA
jgi:hypothetical protein